MNKRWLLLYLTLLLMVGGIAACTTANPTPDPNGPILVGFATLPKSLATINLTITPNPTEAQGTFVAAHPTNTPGIPTLTPSLTPLVGLFMGASTYATGIGVLPTGSGVPFIVFTPLPGTKIGPVPTFGPGTSFAPVPASTLIAPPVVVGSVVPCNTVPTGAPFVKTAQNPSVQQRVGCPAQPAFTLNMVEQQFQSGLMFWRDTKEIYAVSTRVSPDSFWRFPDSWHDGLPSNDPALTPPAGLQQPVRGFGLVWRSNAAIKTALGWAMAGEGSYQAQWQEFERGFMFTSREGTVLVFVPSDGPPVTTGIHYGPFPQ